MSGAPGQRGRCGSVARDVVAFGEIMGNFVATSAGRFSGGGLFELRLAGAELNVAIALARLGHRVGFVGRVGDDPLGELAVARLRLEGIDVSELHKDARAMTALQLKQRVEFGDPLVVYYRRHAAGSLLEPEERSLAYIAAARHLHVTGIPPALSVSSRAFAHAAIDAARAAGATVSFDPNLRPALWPDREEMLRVVGDFAARADWVLPGVSEGAALTGHTDPRGIADHYLSRGAKAVAVKLGAKGALLFTPDGYWSCPPFPVRAIDTLGAGDGFAAGFISGALDGLSPLEQLRRACAVGALATTNEGDCDGMPTRTHVAELLTVDSMPDAER